MAGRDHHLVALGKHLADLRLERDLTQEQLAERAKLTSKYVSEIERGVVNPSFTVLRTIARALGMSLARVVATPADLDLEITALLADASSADKHRALIVVRALVKKGQT